MTKYKIVYDGKDYPTRDNMRIVTATGKLVAEITLFRWSNATKNKKGKVTRAVGDLQGIVIAVNNE